MATDEELTAYNKVLNDIQIQKNVSQIGAMQQEQALQEKERGMIGEQLDVNEILDRVHHLLQGHIVRRDEKTGTSYWAEPENNDQKVLTEHGVNYLMGAIQWYLNKNTLLSNYDEQVINNKMLDLSITLIDNMFMEYDKMFLQPTLLECEKELQDRLQKKLEQREFRANIMKNNFDADKEAEKLLKEIEPRIDNELESIRQQKVKNKLKRFESLMRFVQDTIHSAYMRAWKGQERTTLRQHIHVSETKGMIPQEQRRSWNPLSVFGGRK